MCCILFTQQFQEIRVNDVIHQQSPRKYANAGSRDTSLYYIVYVLLCAYYPYKKAVSTSLYYLLSTQYVLTKYRMAIIWKLCNFKCSSIEGYNRHQGLHRNWANISFRCMYTNCFAQFRTYNSFKLHIFRCHISHRRNARTLMSQVLFLLIVRLKTVIFKIQTKNRF